MGAPKQKWTSEEESALKAGVVKHGAGKWRTILKDPEFSGILSLRSNVDLKDKWRNMSVTANGWGSREKARLALRKSQHSYKQESHDEDKLALRTEIQSDEEVVDVKPHSVSDDRLQVTGPKKPNSRLQDLIIKAITSLNEPTGSNKADIGTYIEDQYNAPPDFKRILSTKLKALTANGKLIKVKRKYRIAPSSRFSEGKRSEMLLIEARQKDSPKVDTADTRTLTKSQINAELAKMRNTTQQEAAATAARAVAEAEAAIAEAEEAAVEAQEAEKDAEEAQAFAEAAAMTLKNRSKLMVHA